MSKTTVWRTVAGVLVAAGTLYAGYHAYHPSPSASKAATVAVEDDYTCAMHRQVHEHHGGPCPICGMTMVKRSALAPATASQSVATSGLGDVALSPEQMVMANVRTEAVAMRRVAPTLTAPGRVTYDETRLSEVTSWVDGRLQRLYVNSTGAIVRAGEAIGTIYSPDLLSAMREYLTAVDSFNQVSSTSNPDVIESAKLLIDASRTKLVNLGVSTGQLRRLERTRQVDPTVELIAHQSGVVLKKQVQPGQYVKTGDVLFDVADLSRVWVEAAIFEAQMADVAVGRAATITTPTYPGRTFEGVISFIYPYLDPQSRTVKVRVSLSNPRGLLKPDMFVTASLETASSEERLAVPSSAVIDTGKRKIVYVETQPGHFQPRQVTLGMKSDAAYPVLGGLMAGDKVAVSGGFLLDANSQLQAQGGGELPGTEKPTADSGQNAAQAPKGRGDSMPGMKM